MRGRLRRFWLGRVVLAVLMAAAGTLAGLHAFQEDPLDVRLEKTAGIAPDAARTFFDALRRNVGQNDHGAACAMLAYPLQHATGVVKDAAECAAQYDSLFTIPVRRAIGKQRFEEVFVNQSGVMLGSGEVWFAGACKPGPCRVASEVKISTLNSDTASLVQPKGKLLLACVVSGQKIRVAADGSGGASLSVWYAPDFTGAAAREFPRATSQQSAPACGSRTWTFDDGTRHYTVSELPCDAYLSPPPMGSVGRVTLTTPASADGEPLWCRDLQD